MITAYNGQGINLPRNTSSADASLYIVVRTDPVALVHRRRGRHGGNPGRETLPFNFPASGTYYLVLDSYGTGLFGNWTLTGTNQCGATGATHGTWGKPQDDVSLVRSDRRSRRRRSGHLRERAAASIWPRSPAASRSRLKRVRRVVSATHGSDPLAKHSRRNAPSLPPIPAVLGAIVSVQGGSAVMKGLFPCSRVGHPWPARGLLRGDPSLRRFDRGGADHSGAVARAGPVRPRAGHDEPRLLSRSRAFRWASRSH